MLHVLLFALFLASGLAAGATPVVLMHGLAGRAEQMENLAERLRADTPGRYVLPMEIGNGANTSIFVPIDEQVAEFAEKVSADGDLADGFHLICHSQGAIICRTYVEEYNQPRVKSLILLAGPNAGFFCDKRENCEFLGALPDYVEILDEKLMYSDFIQGMVAPTNYWKDPFKLEKYLTGCRTLPRIDNELAGDQNAEKPARRSSTPESRKAQLESLEKLVLVGSPNDGAISPWQSSLFEFYEDGSNTTVRSLRSSELYDAIGLRTLNEAGRMVRIISGMTHSAYLSGEGLDWVERNLFKYLRN